MTKLLYLGKFTAYDGKVRHASVTFQAVKNNLRRHVVDSNTQKPFPKEVTDGFDVITHVTYSSRLKEGWKEYLDPEGKTWAPGRSQMGEKVRLEHLRKVWLEDNEDPRLAKSTPIPSTTKDNKAKTVKKPVNLKKEKTGAGADKPRAKYYENTSIKVSTDHIPAKAYKAYDRNATHVINDFLVGKLVPVSTKEGRAEFTTLEMLESAFLRYSHRISRTDVMEASKDLRQHGLRSILKSTFWKPYSFLETENIKDNPVARLLRGEKCENLDILRAIEREGKGDAAKKRKASGSDSLGIVSPPSEKKPRYGKEVAAKKRNNPASEREDMSSPPRKRTRVATSPQPQAPTARRGFFHPIKKTVYKGCTKEWRRDWMERNGRWPKST